MGMKIIVISIMAYLILFCSCLTFRLRFGQRLVLAGIVSVNILFVKSQIGNFFVFPMLVLVIVYISWIKKEEWAINAMLLIFSYIISVIVENFTYLICNILDLDVHWSVYVLIDYPIFFFLCHFMSKTIIEIQKKKAIVLSRKTLIALGVELILCVCIFVLHIKIIEEERHSFEILLSSVALHIAYFGLTAFLLCRLIQVYDKNFEIMLKQNSYDNLKEYMVQIEELYQNLRIFQHDYTNVSGKE